MRQGRDTVQGGSVAVDLETLKQVDSLARFPDENPNPVMRIARPTGILQYANAKSSAVLSHWGTKVKERVPQHIYEIVDAACQCQEPRSLESTFDGRTFELFIVPVPDVDYANIYGMEITARVAAEALVRDQAKFPNENPNPVLRISADGRVLYANGGSSVLLKHWQCADTCLLPENLCNVVTSVLKRGEGTKIEEFIGAKVYELELSPVADQGYLNLYGRDITAQRRAESAMSTAHDQAVRAGEKLQETLAVLERRNEELELSMQMLDEQGRDRGVASAVLSELEAQYMAPLAKALSTVDPSSFEGIGPAQAAIAKCREQIYRLSTQRAIEQKAAKKSVLLAESNGRRRALAKVALRGLGLQLDSLKEIAGDSSLPGSVHYDLLCFSQDMLEVAVRAHEDGRANRFVLMTGASVQESLPILLRYPFITSVVARYDVNRATTVRNLIVTVQKLVTRDIFGVHRYLSWGAEVSELRVASSADRAAAIEKMVDDVAQAGIRVSVRTRLAMIAEEMLMNALYDAPRDAEGEPRFNHVLRTERVDLDPASACTLRWGFDGNLMVVAVEDPFGALTRDVVLEYLQGCYSGRAGKLNEENIGKAGAGMGLFQIMAASDLLVLNAVRGLRTEVISMLDLDSKDSRPSGSLHFFFDDQV